MKMATLSAGALRTRFDIAVWRYGWLWLLVLALALILMALELGWQPRQQASLETQRTALTQQQQISSNRRIKKVYFAKLSVREFSFI